MFRKKLILITAIAFSGILLKAQSSEEDPLSIPEPERGIRLLADSSGASDFLNSVKVSGDGRFFAIYRDMSVSYPDQVTADRNLAFLSYPNAAGGNAAGKPLAEIALTAKPSPRSQVGIGFALAHVFTGENGDSSRFAQIRNLLNFNGKVSTDYGLFSVEAGGGVLWTNLSPLTMSNPEYRPDNFDRLPWDWYTDSWQKYNDFYNASASLGGERIGAIGFQGFKFSGDGLPGNIGIKAMLGRTNQSLEADAVASNPQNFVAAGKITKIIGSVKVGVNYYRQDGLVDNIDPTVLNSNNVTAAQVTDLQEIITAEAQATIKGVKLYAELGTGRVENPLSEGNGLAFIGRANVSEKNFGFPINFQAFSIDHNVVSNVSSSLNSNADVPNGGFGRDPNFATQLFINALQETGQVTNNRRGFSISSGKQINKLKIELGLGLSQEIENIYDTITFQHRANAFSRSRFNPWVQSAGPQQRIKNVFRRSYEFIGITDGGEDYKKGYSSLDLSFNYKTRFLRKPVILKVYQNVGTIQDRFLPRISDDAFLRQWYIQGIAFIKLTAKVSGLVFYEQERTVANVRTDLSDFNREPLSQVGDGFGYGLDYDFSKFAGLYFRHRWLYHQDKNFVTDNFQGQELTMELKVFF